MTEVIETTGNKVDDLSFVHGVGLGQGLTQQGFTFLNLELLGSTFLALEKKTEKLIEAQAADSQLRELASISENFQKLNDNQSILASTLFAHLFYQTELRHPAFETINVSKVAEGISCFVQNKKMPSENMIKAYSEVMNEFQTKIEAEKQAEAKLAGDEGYKFLAENAKKEGIHVTPSGLQYEVLQAGEGDSPSAENEVTVHYEGTTIDGKVFDSSYARGEQISFGLNQVIRGWTEGLQLMNPGAKYKFYIPQELAYGDRGAGADIPPFAALIFTVELFSFK